MTRVSGTRGLALGALVVAACGSASPELPRAIAGHAGMSPKVRLWRLYALDGSTYLPLPVDGSAAEPGDPAERIADAVHVPGDPVPAHGTPVLTHPEAGVEVAIADARDPGTSAKLRGRPLYIDGACTASVGKFRIVGSEWAAGECDDCVDSRTPAERVEADAATAERLLRGEYGDAYFVADVDGCRGVYASDQPWSPITTADLIEDPRLTDLARATFVAAAANVPPPPEWRDGTWRNGATIEHGSWYDGAQFEIRIIRHPRTGVLWASVHAQHHECCDELHANVWGLLRISADRQTATVERLRTLAPRVEIDGLVDLDGTGTLDILDRAHSPMPIAGDDLEAVEALRKRTSCPC